MGGSTRAHGQMTLMAARKRSKRSATRRATPLPASESTIVWGPRTSTQGAPAAARGTATAARQTTITAMPGLMNPPASTAHAAQDAGIDGGPQIVGAQSLGVMTSTLAL